MSKIKYYLTKCEIISIKACPLLALGFIQSLQLLTPKPNM